jgi:tetratricopeptide (TPR) repeat protein
MAGLIRWSTRFAWLVLAIALLACAAFVVRWHATHRINAMIAARTIEKLAPLPADPRVRYAAGWDFERLQKLDEAARYFTDVQASDDPALTSQAWFALGNTYFETAIRASRTSTEEGPRTESAEFELARDAYRAALRIDPAMHGARYNLELLERLAPRRPGDGWRRNTDPITIVPSRHNGWTTILESAKRGLP